MAELKALVDQMPDADQYGRYTEGIDKQKIESAIAAIHAGGREYVLGLIDLLAEPGSEANVKPHYALHCLANHLLIVKDEEGRRDFCRVLCGELGGDRPTHIQAFLCQELGWVGDRNSAPALGRLLTDEELCGPASMALISIGDGVAKEFRVAWPKAKGLARRHIMDALAALPDPRSTEILTGALNDQDQEVRIAAAHGLAALGDADATGLLFEFVDATQGWEKIQATKCCLMLAEALTAKGKSSEARRIYEQLRDEGDYQQHIRDAAKRGLAALA
jgi:hypothetical protein